MKSKNTAVIEIAKKYDGAGENEPVYLSTGVLARIVPVSAALLDEAQSSVPIPKVPTWYNKDKERDEENPNHPDYLAAIDTAERKRNMASIDVMIMFGVVLVDQNGDEVGAPKDNSWLSKLIFMDKRGVISLGDVDFDDELEREFIYKKYVAVGVPDIFMITRRVGIDEEEVQKALNSFRDNEA